METRPFEEDWDFLFRPPATFDFVRTHQINQAIFRMMPVPELSISVMETQVTQELYEAVMGENPSAFDGKPQNPVENVAWHSAVDFCKRLSHLTKKAFRLPTKEEWEFCSLRTYPVTLLGKAYSTYPVDKKLPNAFGLQGMFGNVWQWTSTATPTLVNYHYMCGGSWRTTVVKGDMSCHDFTRYDDVGFRCAMDLV